MKTPSISLVGAILLSCGLGAASVQPLFAQKKGLPVPQVNGNKNGNQNPPPATVVKKVVPRRVSKTEVKVEAIPKQMVPPIQKRVEQPKLPPGMERMGPGGNQDKVKDLAKLKLLPPLQRGGNGTGNAALVEGAEVGNTSTFPPIGDDPLDQLGNRIRDLAFAKEAGEMGDLAGMLGFADLINGLDSLIPDLGLGGSGDESGFADADELAEFGGSGGSRKDGLPDDAPPSGWGAWGGIAGTDATVNITSDGTETKTWDTTDDNGVVTHHYSSSSPNGDTFNSETWESGGYTNRVTRSQSSDGTARSESRSVDSNGEGGARSFIRDADGNINHMGGRVSGGTVEWGSSTRVWDSVGPVYQEGRVANGVQPPPWMRDFGGNPGDEGTTESQRALANWMWRKHNLGKTTPGGGPKMTTYVNPGSPDYEGAGLGGYPSIGAAFAGNFAVNPDPTSMSSGGGTPSARAWRLMQQDLKNGATPGPMPGAEDPRSER